MNFSNKSAPEVLNICNFLSFLKKYFNATLEICTFTPYFKVKSVYLPSKDIWAFKAKRSPRATLKFKKTTRHYSHMTCLKEVQIVSL